MEEVAAANAAAKAKDPEAAPIEIEPLPPAPATTAPQKTIRADGGSVTAYTSWTFKVVDPDKVPREYLKVDETAIRAAVRLGAREIPGVDIYEATNIRVG